ncbi:zinc-binding dehydrogenase [Streptomyces olivochromogenes]|uniref:zinc-binding dehydrogenase n=1 Tax=Streptomyces olivochromogenes TaxID=1963 RepID=UPI0027E3FBF6|nr:zinc-binding dehydrogenase [Streptomyces olivochromogenes]
MSARGDGGLHLQKHYGQGSFAELLMVPTENAFPMGAIDPAEAGRWNALSVCLVPYGRLLAADLRAGETVLVSGATGNVGSAGVAVALAMGAGCVVAPGRNQDMLTELEDRFGSRLRVVPLSGDENENENEDHDRMKQAAPGPIDVVLDLLPPSAWTTPVRAAAMTVREYGRVVLMGGVGMLGGEDLALPYPWIMRNSITVRGQWMYRPQANTRLIELARFRLLDLHHFDVTEFALDIANKAIEHATDSNGPEARYRIAPSCFLRPHHGGHGLGLLAQSARRHRDPAILARITREHWGVETL